MKKPANHKSYRIKADNLFMAPYRGLPCEICGSTYRTVGHHNVPKSRCRALRFEPRNITVLCPTHHTLGNEICAHSPNVFVVERYLAWFKKNHPYNYEWLKENANIQRKYTYRQAAENLAKGEEAHV